MHSRSSVLSVLCLLIIAVACTQRVYGAPLFQTAQTFSTGDKIGPMAVGDMNGDGKPDIVIVNQSTCGSCDVYVAISLGNGDGTFQAPVTFDSGLTSGTAIAVADLNGDSKLDVVVLGNEIFSVLLGNGDGTVGTHHGYTAGSFGTLYLVLADLNHDGKVDLVIGGNCVSTCASNMSVLLGRGDGTFQPVQEFSSGASGLVGIAVSDVNGDGKEDVMVAHSLGNAGVLLGNGDGTLQTEESFSTNGVYPGSLIAADLNHDGKPDMIMGVYNPGTGHANVGVLLGNGDGSFQSIKLYDTNVNAPSGAFPTVTGDVNGDGKLDVIGALDCPGACDTSPIVVMLGNGDGTLQKAQRFYSGGRNHTAVPGIALADFNGDSKPDIAVTNECVNLSDCSTGTVGILLGTSGVQTTTTITSSLNPSVYGQSVTLNASVTSVGKNTPTGTVTFLNGSTGIATVSLIDGVASKTKTNLPAGSLSITAKYNGDTNSAKSVSAPLIQVVKKASTTTTLLSSLNPSTAGQSVTFTATVTSPTTVATGTVTFTRGGQTLGTITLSGGKAKLTISTLPVGSDSVTATYNGTPNISGSKKSLTQVVN
jgi:hypothetical protein